MAGRSCLFCGSKPVTKEHIFPAWLNEHLRTVHDFRYDVKRYEFRDAPRDEWTTPHVDLTVRRFCGPECNNGWMAELEADTQPIILRLLQSGDESVDVSPAEQAQLSEWAYKTALVADLVISPKPQRIPASVYTDFYKTRNIPSDTLIWMAAHAGPGRTPGSTNVVANVVGAKRGTRTYPPSKEPDPREVDTFRFITTLTVFRVVFWVFGHLSQQPLPRDYFEPLLRNTCTGMARIWPVAETVAWPVNQTAFDTACISTISTIEPRLLHCRSVS